MMSASRPIEIIGGGLAGLSLGVALRRHGIDTTVIDAGVYPRHRVCGEFITGLPKHTIEQLGLESVLHDAQSNQEITWFAGGEVVRRQRLPAPALSLSRFVLDARLAESFVAAGGTLVTNSRSNAKSDAPGRVFATGRRRADATWLGLKVHAHRLALHSDLELHLGNHAYVGLARIEDDRVNICGLFRRETGPSSQPHSSGRSPRSSNFASTGASFSRAEKSIEPLLKALRAAELPDLAVRVASAEIDSESFSAVAALGFDRHVSVHAELRLGDACAMIPPFTGHGMAMAFQSAEIAFDPLVAYARGELEWVEARRRIQSRLQRRFRLRLLAARGFHSFLFAPRKQRWLAWFNRAHLLPLRPIYSALH